GRSPPPKSILTGTRSRSPAPGAGAAASPAADGTTGEARGAARAARAPAAATSAAAARRSRRHGSPERAQLAAQLPGRVHAGDEARVRSGDLAAVGQYLTGLGPSVHLVEQHGPGQVAPVQVAAGVGVQVL